jgi:hypothetical protein
LTDHEIKERFQAAWRNHQHELVESGYWQNLMLVENPRAWREYCDRLHAALEKPPTPQAAGEDMLNVVRQLGIPVLN